MSPAYHTCRGSARLHRLAKGASSRLDHFGSPPRSQRQKPRPRARRACLALPAPAAGTAAQRNTSARPPVPQLPGGPASGSSWRSYLSVRPGPQRGGTRTCTTEVAGPHMVLAERCAYRQAGIVTALSERSGDYRSSPARSPRHSPREGGISVISRKATTTSRRAGTGAGFAARRPCARNRLFARTTAEQSRDSSILVLYMATSAGNTTRIIERRYHRKFKKK